MPLVKGLGPKEIGHFRVSGIPRWVEPKPYQAQLLGEYSLRPQVLATAPTVLHGGVCGLRVGVCGLGFGFRVLGFSYQGLGLSVYSSGLGFRCWLQG
mmetsp:Transcript_42596/g.66720  ORF Transcript_42596/g.66720 Transcript_42596/m.66720 type:complete len:97 (-) Transcript_42596:107-397(-)